MSPFANRRLNRNSIPLLAAMLLAGGAVVAEAQTETPSYRAFNPTPTVTGDYYGLLDLDNNPEVPDPVDIPVSPDYAYARWGVLMSDADLLRRPGYRTWVFTDLTVPPFSNVSSELFLLKQKTDLSLMHQVTFPSSADWSPYAWTGSFGYDSVTIPVSEPVTNDATVLMRRYHFSNVQIDEMSGHMLSSDAQKVIVLVHGWNPDGAANAYDSVEFNRLAEGLRARLLGKKDWSLVLYRWEQDADTGPSPTTGVSEPNNFGPINGNEAAEAGHLHGIHLAHWLAERCPGLKRVHFIAHSAGSWMARAAARRLAIKNPVDVQVTLLDPYIPGNVVGVSSNLTADRMAEIQDISGQGRIWRAENYFANDPFTLGTNSRLFNGGAGLDVKVGIGEPLDTEPLDYYRSFRVIGPYVGYYDGFGHAGPIAFYADSVAYNFRDDLLIHKNEIEKFDVYSVGWRRSILMCEPVFLGGLQPELNAPIGVAIGNPATISGQAITWAGGDVIKYEWLRNNEKVSNEPGRITASVDGQTATLAFSQLTAADQGEYVLRAISSTGLVTDSQPVGELAVIPTLPAPAPTLTINSVAPGSLNTMALGQRQWITLTGTGFTNATVLVFNDGYADYDSNAAYLDYRSPTEIRYNIAVGPTSGTWSVKALNGSLEQSAPRSFQVVAAGVQLLGLTVAGPAHVNENSAALYTAIANYSDGSKQVVSATWTNSGSGAGIGAASGLLITGEVTGDTGISITASYPVNGTPVTASIPVTVVNVAGAGTATQELLTNGTFSDGVSGWNASGDFQADARFPTYHNGAGYAYLATLTGEPGNNLSGQLNRIVQIPANASAVTLSYWYRITTLEDTANAADFLFLRILNSAGNGVLQILDGRSNLHANAQYEQRSFDLIAYAGQSVMLSFAATTDAEKPTVFRIDDVDIQVTTSTTTPPAGAGVIEVTRSGDTIPNGSTTTTLESRTYFDSHWMGETTALYSYRINNRGSGLLNLTGTPLVRIDGSSSFAIAQPPAGSVAAASYSSFQIRFDPQSVGSHTATVIIRSNDANNPEYRFAIRGEGKFRDIQAPVVSITTPAGSAPVATDSAALSLAGSATDNVSITQVAWSNDRGGGGTASGTNFWNIESVPLRSGNNLITVSARDPAGLTGIATLVVTYTPSVPEITVSPVSLFQHATQGLVAGSQTFTIRNSGSGNLNYSVTASSEGGWLSVSPATGTSTGEAGLITVNYASAGLALGAHQASLTVTADGAADSPLTIPVSLRVTTSTANLPFEARSAVQTGIYGQTFAAAADGGSVAFGLFTGTYTTGGQTVVAAGSNDVFAAKLDAGGQVVWLKRYGGSNDDGVWSCAPHPQGGWIFCGHFKDAAGFGPVTLSSNGGNSDAYIARISENGDVLWAQRVGGTNSDYGKGAAVDAAGNCYFIGSYFGTATIGGSATTLSASGTGPDIFVVKYSAGGIFQWVQSVGGSLYDDVYCSGADADGNLYLGGVFEQQASFGPYTLTVGNPISGSWDAYLVKITPSGQVAWAKSFGEPSGGYSGESIGFVGIDEAGNCIFGGNYHGPLVAGDKQLPVQNAYTSAFVGKISAAGTIAWLKAIPAADYSSAERCAFLEDGGILVGGRYRGLLNFGPSALPAEGNAYQADLFFAKFDPAGEAAWAIAANSPNNSDFPRYMGTGNGGTVKFFADIGGNATTLPGLGPVALGGDGAWLVELGPQLLNTAPSIGSLADIGIAEDGQAGPIIVAVDDLETPVVNLTLSGSSSNAALVPDQNIAFSGSGSQRTVTVTPLPNQTGVTVITFTVGDGTLTATSSFSLSVAAVNDSPDRPGNRSPADGATDQPVTLTLEGGPFTDPEGDVHAASQWQVLDAAGMTIFWNSGEDQVHLTSCAVPVGQIAYAGNYRWQVRFRDSQGAWSQYSAPTGFSTSAKLSQSIAFSPSSSVIYTSTPLPLVATATSGLAVSYAVIFGPAVASGANLSFTGIGLITVRASQAGDETYLAAPMVDRSLLVRDSFNWWRTTQFTADERSDFSLSGDLADPDGDGLSNQLEYALGLGPKTADTNGLPEFGSSGSDWIYTYTRPSDRSDLVYEVEVSTDLSSWSVADLNQVMLLSVDGIETWQVRYPHSSAEMIYFRLKVTRL